jgi:hypothetical protein
MTVIYRQGQTPAYVIESTDIDVETGGVPTCIIKGALVFSWDDGKWYVIDNDLVLQDYTLPVAVTMSASDIEIGAVEIKNSGDDTRATVGANGLYADVRALPAIPAGENHIGMIGGVSVQVDVTPTLTVHATYVANDYVGTSGTPMTFANAARVNAGTGVVVGAVLVDAALQSIAGELWLFDTAPTPPNDSAAWTITDAEAAKCIGIIPFGGTTAPYYASAANSVCPVGGLSILFKTGAASKDLFGCFVTRGAPTYASGDLTFRLRIWQD